MATATKKIESATKKFAVKVIFDSSSTASMHREGLPIIIDKNENVAPWLKSQSFEEKDIEVIGNKPENWDSVFNPPAPVEEVAPAKEIA